MKPEGLGKLGTLGPDGSFSSIAARQYLRGSGEVVFYSSIPILLRAVHSGKIDGALVPIENQLAGPVTETLDVLAKLADKVELVDSVVFPISHAIGARNPKTVSTVKSHPQALSQCSNWLDKNFPSAERVPTSSTSSGISDAGSSNDTAAIGPEETLLNSGLKVIASNINNQSNNQTRFTLVSRKGASSLSKQDCRYSTLFIVDPKRDRQGLLFDLLNLVSKTHGLNLQSIQSRPDEHGWFVFHFAVEGHKDDDAIKNCFNSILGYFSSTGQSAELNVLGSVPLSPFYRSDLKSIAIVGGNGGMGKWLNNLLSGAGLDVSIIEKGESKENVRLKVEAADAVLFSVPMSAIERALQEISPFLKDGQLLVENCSVKSASLPQIKKKVSNKVEVLGMHTMFGPTVESLRSQNVVFTRTTSSGELASQFEDIFYKFGAVTSHVPESSHDTVTAYTQALTHFLLLGYLRTVKKAELEPELFSALSTPNSRMLESALARFKADLSENLQNQNQKAASVRKELIAALTELDNAFSTKKAQKLIEEILKN